MEITENVLNEHDNQLKQAEILDHFHVYITYNRTPVEALERIALTTNFRDKQSKEFIHALNYIYTSNNPKEALDNIHKRYSENVTESLEIFYVIFKGKNHQKAADHLRKKNTYNEAKKIFAKIILLDNSLGINYSQKEIFKIISKNEKNPKIRKELSKTKTSVDAFSTIIPKHVNMLVKDMIKNNLCYGYIDIIELEF